MTVKYPKWTPTHCEHCQGSGLMQRINPDWLRSQRTRAGISLRGMARHMGVSAAYLSDIERGKRNGNQVIIEAYGELKP